MAEWWAPSSSTKSTISTCQNHEGFVCHKPIHIRHVIMAKPYGTWCVKLRPPPPPDWPGAGGLSSKVAAIHAA